MNKERTNVISKLLKHYKTSEEVHKIFGYPIEEIRAVSDNYTD